VTTLEITEFKVLFSLELFFAAIGNFFYNVAWHAGVEYREVRWNLKQRKLRIMDLWDSPDFKAAMLFWFVIVPAVGFWVTLLVMLIAGA